jgi:hypothetical protein
MASPFFRACFFVPVLAALASLVGCNGTAGGSSGDPHVKPNPTEYGAGEKIHNIIGPATWFNTSNMFSVGCKSPGATTHYTTGQVVTAVDRFDETGTGATGNIYIQDIPLDGADPPPYSGAEVFAPSYTPPDLQPYPGDVVDFLGSFTEFLGPSAGLFPECKTLPEIEGDITLRFENGAVTPLTIVKAGTDATRFDPIRGYTNARQWLGMLVRIEGVSLPAGPVCQSNCPNPNCEHCRYNVGIDTGGGIEQGDQFTMSNELFDLKNEGPPFPSTGTSFKAITGIVTYFYGFNIAVRSIDDIEM